MKKLFLATLFIFSILLISCDKNEAEETKTEKPDDKDENDDDEKKEEKNIFLNTSWIRENGTYRPQHEFKDYTLYNKIGFGNQSVGTDTGYYEKLYNNFVSIDNGRGNKYYFVEKDTAYVSENYTTNKQKCTKYIIKNDSLVYINSYNEEETKWYKYKPEEFEKKK